jgi:hypothetical protein
MGCNLQKVRLKKIIKKKIYIYIYHLMILACTLYTRNWVTKPFPNSWGGGGLVLEVLKAEGPGSVVLEDFFCSEP